MTRRRTIALVAALALWTLPGMANCANPPMCSMDDLMPNSADPFRDVPQMPRDNMTPMRPVEDRSWHLLTRTYGGTITLLRDLTKDECRKMQSLVLPDYSDGESHMVMYGEIVSAECFQ